MGDDGYDLENDGDGNDGDRIPRKTTKKTHHPGGGDGDPDDNGDDGAQPPLRAGPIATRLPSL